MPPSGQLMPPIWERENKKKPPMKAPKSTGSGAFHHVSFPCFAQRHQEGHRACHPVSRPRQRVGPIVGGDVVHVPAVYEACLQQCARVVGGIFESLVEGSQLIPDTDWWRAASPTPVLDAVDLPGKMESTN